MDKKLIALKKSDSEVEYYCRICGTKMVHVPGSENRMAIIGGEYYICPRCGFEENVAQKSDISNKNK